MRLRRWMRKRLGKARALMLAPPLLLIATLLVLVRVPFRAHALNIGNNPSQSPPLASRIRHRLWRSPPSTSKRIVSIPINAPEQDIHVQMMEYALDEARQAGQMGEVPIGAIVVRELTPPVLSRPRLSLGSNTTTATTREFEFLSTGRNLVETKMDASAHAELEAMKVAASRINNWRLLNATLYSTLEPCPMCLAAAQAFRCKSVVYGAPDLRLGAVETHIQLLEMAKHPYHEVEAVGGILEVESAALLRDFFHARRKGQRSPRAENSQNGERKGRAYRIIGRALGSYASSLK